MMKYDAKYILRLIEVHGSIEKALNYIDIEQIDDLTIKIICRTFKASCEGLMAELNDIVNPQTSTAPPSMA